MRQRQKAFAAALVSAVLCCAPAAVLGADLRIVPLSPLPETSADGSRPAIVFEIRSSADVSVDLSDIRFTVDGIDETSRLQIDGTHLIYVPAQPLEAGTHLVAVAVDVGATGVAANSWQFDAGGGGDAVYYAGDRIRLVFAARPGGHGYVTFRGFPGRFALRPLGPGYAFVTFIVPQDYAGPAPVAECHYFAPGIAPAGLTIERRLTVREGPRPAEEIPAFERSQWLPQTASGSTVVPAFTSGGNFVLNGRGTPSSPATTATHHGATSSQTPPQSAAGARR